MIHEYQCVLCNGRLSYQENSYYFCEVCNRKYPVINDIAIIIPKYNSALLSIKNYIEHQSTKLSNLQHLHYRFDDCYIFDKEITVMLNGIRKNIDLVEQTCGPVKHYLNSQQANTGMLDWFYFLGPTLPFDYMLRYFYQDWYGTESFKQVRELIINGALQYRKDNDSCVVLGCAACGILYHLSQHFDVSHGFDLDIPTLMTANELMKADKITIYPENARWKKICLKSPPKTTGTIALAAANIMRLPLQDASVSLLVTQYMMDLDSNNPSYLVREINRVLRDDGIWINFSIPFKLPGTAPQLGVISEDGLSLFMNRFGFELAEFEQVRFKAWNFEAVTNKGSYPNHEVHFFIAKKNKPVQQSKIYSYFSDYFSGRNNDLLKLVPNTLTDRSLSVIDRTEFKEGRTDAQIALGVKLSATYREFPIKESQRKLICNILNFVNGKHTLADIYKKVSDQYSELSEEELMEFFHALSIYYFFILFNEEDNGL